MSFFGPMSEVRNPHEESRAESRRQVVRVRHVSPNHDVAENPWLCCNCLFTRTGTVDVIERFGRFERMQQPGFSWVPCLLGYTRAGTVSMRVCKLDTVVETKTKDGAFVDIIVSVQYTVLNQAVHEAFYKLAMPQEQLKAYVFDSVRSIVPRMTLDEVFVQKGEVAGEVKESLARAMADYGYAISHVLVTDIDPDPDVKDAMNGVLVAARHRSAATDVAEAEKVRIIKAAEADGEAKYLAGMGVGRQREAIADAMARSMDKLASRGIDSREILETILATQYMDALREIGSNGRNATIFIPHGVGAAADMRGGIMQGLAAMQQPPMSKD